ncbi:MAG TPA: thioredoxin domain-containing protein [Actinocrinis sp.]|nr:thioredoxin domain-containing protein [Actinocrinis sp.]
MSKANRTGKELARERVAQMRVEQARKARQRRQYTIIGSVIGVIVVALVVSLVVNNALKPKTPTVFPANAVADVSGGVAQADAEALPIGDANAPVKMTVYEDFRCSQCEAFETTFQASYKQLVAAGTLQLLIHPVDLIDQNYPGTSGSLAAGNAAGCAQDAGKFEDFHDVLYKNQPAETTDSFGNSTTLIGFAKQVTGLDTPTFEACVKSGKYDDWVRQNYADLQHIDTNGAATPTVLLNGKAYTLPAGSTAAASAAQFVTDVNKLAGVSASATPTAGSSAGASSSAGPSATAPATTATTIPAGGATPTVTAS